MLDKKATPSFEDLLAYCGERGELWRSFDDWIKNEFAAQTLIRFPYGKDYGWAVKYARGSRHICDIFAENGAFTLFCKIREKIFDSIESALSDYSKKVYENKYPCGEGGWIRYRITSAERVADAKKLLQARMKP